MTVLVGIAVNGKAVAGVIHQPYYNYLTDDKNLGRTIWGLVDYGVGGFEPKIPPSKTLTVVTTRSHSNETVQRALDALNPDEIVKVGGAGHKVSFLQLVVTSLFLFFFVGFASGGRKSSCLRFCK